MFHVSFIFLAFILTMTMANPCPCEVITNEQLSNNPPSTITDPATINELIDNKFLEDYLDRLTSASQSEISAESYPLLRQVKSLDLIGQRYKRPSWAAIGKRALLLHKRPSWAPIG